MSVVNQNGVGGGGGPGSTGDANGGGNSTGSGSATSQDRKWQGKKHSKHEVKSLNVALKMIVS